MNNCKIEKYLNISIENMNYCKIEKYCPQSCVLCFHVLENNVYPLECHVQ